MAHPSMNADPEASVSVYGLFSYSPATKASKATQSSVSYITSSTAYWMGIGHGSDGRFYIEDCYIPDDTMTNGTGY